MSVKQVFVKQVTPLLCGTQLTWLIDFKNDYFTATVG